MNVASRQRSALLNARARPRACRVTSPVALRSASTSSHTTTVPIPTTLWTRFAEKASGEWEGVTVSYDASGAPLPLPEHYVPQAYREWGVEVQDWQTTCSCLANPEQPGAWHMMVRRMMPTVGCEADSVAYTEEQSGAKTASGTCVAVPPPTDPTLPAIRVVTEWGGYVSAPLQLAADASGASAELCIPKPPTQDPADTKVHKESSEEKAQPRRMRFVFHLLRNWQTGEWGLSKIDMHVERYLWPYRGTLDLCGCGGGMKPFAKIPGTPAQQLQGPPSRWSAVSSWSVLSPEGGGYTESAGPWPSAFESPELQSASPMGLPLGVWVRSSVGGKEGEVHVEVGGFLSRLPRPSHAMLAACSFQGGRLVQAVAGMGRRPVACECVWGCFDMQGVWLEDGKLPKESAEQVLT